MTIDKEKLQKLLWAEAASYRADCADWKRNTEALQEFLGEKTVEEVALELLAENEDLKTVCAAFDRVNCKVKAENDRLSASPERQIIRAAVTEAVKGIADAAAADAKAGTLKEIEQLKAEVDSLTREADRQYTTIEAYRHDAERYRFLCEKFGETKLPCAIERILSGDLYVADGKPSIDLAIDTAMSKAVQP